LKPRIAALFYAVAEGRHELPDDERLPQSKHRRSGAESRLLTLRNAKVNMPCNQ